MHDSTTPTYQTIRYDVAEQILTITLHRPERLNAFTAQMRAELIDAFDRADADDSVRVVIVTGAGRGFCAGADLSEGAGRFDVAARAGAAGGAIDPGSEAARDSGGRLALRIFASLKPVIAAVNGPAVGIGATMLLPMDMRLASTEARFGFVFARRGLVPEACSSWFLPRLVGMAQAMEWVATGRVFPAGEARAGGLVRSLHAPEELLPAARALAREIADNTAPVSVALSRQMMWRMLGADHPMEAHRIDSRGILARGRSADVREGVTAFLEKRPARFTDKVSSDMPAFFPWWTERPYG
ncbi:MAG TPA: crotonase/enoyl-CoA hydratase family protein [Acetobacteraceae bacterium]|nr:crotonase/enoyl-CoA hydratase family protein [Acetobacteraceae bacterium]